MAETKNEEVDLNMPEEEYAVNKQVQPEDLNIVDRDPADINGYIRVNFPEIFAEPTGLHSPDGVWVCSYKTYNGTKYWCYRILAYICAIPCAFLWGIQFACLAFCHIYYVVPYVKAMMIQFVCVSKVWSICIHTFLDPCYESVALIWSRIDVTFRRTEGEKPTRA